MIGGFGVRHQTRHEIDRLGETAKTNCLRIAVPSSVQPFELSQPRPCASSGVSVA